VENREIETIMSNDLLELLVLLCRIIMQQYILQCTTLRDSSATLLLPPDQHCISNVALNKSGNYRLPGITLLAFLNLNLYSVVTCSYILRR